MKKVFTLMLAFMVLMASSVFADGTVSSSRVTIGRDTTLIIFTCTGDAANGTIPATDIDDTDMKFLRDGKYYLMDVIAFPTPSGTAPDAADVTLKVKDYTIADGDTIEPAVPRDLLQGQGVNLIHATDEQSIGASMPLYERVLGNLTFAVANQATHSANFTVIFKFQKFE